MYSTNIDHFVVDVVDSSHLHLTFITFCLLFINNS